MAALSVVDGEVEKPVQDSSSIELSECRDKVFGLLDAMRSMCLESKFPRDESLRVPALLDVLDRQIQGLLKTGSALPLHPVSAERADAVSDAYETLAREERREAEVEATVKLKAEVGRLNRLVAVQRLSLTRKFHGTVDSRCAGLCDVCCESSEADRKVNKRANEFQEDWDPPNTSSTQHGHSPFAFFNHVMINN